MFSRMFNCFSSPPEPEPELTPEEKEDNTLAMSEHFGYPGEYRTIRQIKKDAIQEGRRLNNSKIPPFVACSRLKKRNPELNAEKYNRYTGRTFVDGIHLFPITQSYRDINKCYVYKKPQLGGKNSSSRIKKYKSKRKSHKRKKSKRKNKSKRTRKKR